MKKQLRPSLNFQYGTLIELHVEIIDGDSLYLHRYQGDYLLKILKINGEKIDKPIIFEFEDHTYGSFPTGNFELYKRLFDKEIERLDSTMIEEMKKKYVGKTFEIVAYESTKSTGKPRDTYKYTGISPQLNFHFINYLVIIRDLNKDSLVPPLLRD
ncbi:hypothetical protein [Dokdonia ponticola]